jgi:hypothetical protein
VTRFAGPLHKDRNDLVDSIVAGVNIQFGGKRRAVTYWRCRRMRSRRSRLPPCRPPRRRDSRRGKLLQREPASGARSKTTLAILPVKANGDFAAYVSETGSPLSFPMSMPA